MSKITQNILVGYAAMVGLVLLSIGSTKRVSGSLTDQGALVTDAPVEASMLKPAAWYYVPVQTIGSELAMGMLMVLFALGIHVLFVLRRQDVQQKSPLTVKRAFAIAIGRY